MCLSLVNSYLQFGLNFIHYEACQMIPNHTQNDTHCKTILQPYPPNHLPRCKIIYSPVRCILLWREELDVDDFMWKHAVEDCENSHKSGADWDGWGQAHRLSVWSNLENPQWTDFFFPWEKPPISSNADPMCFLGSKQVGPVRCGIAATEMAVLDA